MAEIEVVRDVLVVDDEPDIRLLVQAIIEGDPTLRVAAEAASADEALQAMAAGDIDVVILDDQLGAGRTGTEIAAELKEMRPEAIIILYSAVTHPLTRPPGVDACIWKFESELLVPTVRLLLDEFATSG
jgi:DNA-binding NarL/FixJ family response regulator